MPVENALAESIRLRLERSLEGDQADELRQLGVGLVFDVYAEAGSGFASDLHRRFEQEREDRSG